MSKVKRARGMSADQGGVPSGWMPVKRKPGVAGKDAEGQGTEGTVVSEETLLGAWELGQKSSSINSFTQKNVGFRPFVPLLRCLSAKQPDTDRRGPQKGTRSWGGMVTKKKTKTEKNQEFKRRKVSEVKEKICWRKGDI